MKTDPKIPDRIYGRIVATENCDRCVHHTLNRSCCHPKAIANKGNFLVDCPVEIEDEKQRKKLGKKQ